MNMFVVCSVYVLCYAGFIWKRCSAEVLTDIQRRIPKFHPTPTNVTYHKGGLAVLYCSVDNLGTKTVIWRKQPYDIPISVGQEMFVKINRFYLSHVPYREEWNLLIKNVQPFDSGIYECQISSATKVLRRNITLNVVENSEYYKPEMSITGTRFVEKGGTIFLMCNASGTELPPDGIDWFKDGNLLTTKRRNDIRIDKQVSVSSNYIVSRLTISNAYMSDTGTYVCRTSELLTDRFKVDVLNAESFQVKREYEEMSDQSPRSQYSSASPKLLCKTSYFLSFSIILYSIIK